MRTLSTWEQYQAATDANGLLVEQYAGGAIRADVEGGEVRLELATGYPWDGRVEVTVGEAPSTPWTLSLRRPPWAGDGRLTWPDGSQEADPDAGRPGAWSRRAVWRAGDRVVVDLPIAPRITEPDERIDAIRGTLAIERGPLVYCLESADLPGPTVLEDVRLDGPATVVDAPRLDLGEGAVGVATGATMRTGPVPPWPYPAESDAAENGAHRFGEVTAVPYLDWANRGPGGMRVWIPRTIPEESSGRTSG
jgi:DUF1680 family protein